MMRRCVENGFFQGPFPFIQGLCMGENVRLYGFELVEGDRVESIVVSAERYGLASGGFHRDDQAGDVDGRSFVGVDFESGR